MGKTHKLELQTYLFNKYLLNAYNMSGSADIVGNKTDNSLYTGT